MSITISKPFEKRSTKWTTTWAAISIGLLVLATIFLTLSFTVFRREDRQPTASSSSVTSSSGAPVADAQKPTLKEPTLTTPEEETTTPAVATKPENIATATTAEDLDPTTTTTNTTTADESNSTSTTNNSTGTIVVDMDKTEWPELVGMPGEEAMLVIQQENPSMSDVQLVPYDAMVTMDYRTDRVRIFVNNDEQQTVNRPPQVG